MSLTFDTSNNLYSLYYQLMLAEDKSDEIAIKELWEDIRAVLESYASLY